MSGAQVKRLGVLASTVKGYAERQCVFVVLSSRAKDAHVLAIAIGKDPMERLARSYRRGSGTAQFKTACVKAGFLSSPTEVTLFK